MWTSVRRVGGCAARRRGRRRRARAPSRALLWLLLCAVVVEEFGGARAGRDYYDVLGVARDADAADIKRAFRKLAREHHPDKNKGDKTAERLYVELNTAYEVLSDKGKRRRYDQFGEAGLRGQNDPDNDAADSGWGSFESMFGFGGGGRRRQRAQEERRSPSLVVPLSVSLETLYRGGIIEAAHKRRVACTSWADCESRCAHCGGSGVVVTTRRIGPGFVQQIRTHCPKCGGTGKVTRSNCSSCPNGQFEEAEDTLLIDIQPGFADGHRIVYEGISDEIPDHVPGDVYFEVDTEDHPAFHRDDMNNLHYHVRVSLTEALIGIDRAVRQLDGRVVPIRTTGVTVPGQELVIKGEGMPSVDGDSAGDMIVHVDVDFPESISDEQREAILKVHGSPPATEIGNGGGPYTPAGSATAAEDARATNASGEKEEL